VDDSILDLALVDHQDHQNPIARQRQELHLPELWIFLTRYRHQARLRGDTGKEAGSRVHQLSGGFIGVEPRAQH
jgi:hypothetical protein